MILIFQCSAFKALQTTDDGKVPQTTPQWIEVKVSPNSNHVCKRKCS